MADNIPPPPPGFEVEQRAPRQPRPPRGMFGRGAPTPTPTPRGAPLRAAPVDGDTFRLNARLYGADAFESDQLVTMPDGSTVPIGRQAQDFLRSRTGPQTRVQFNGEQTYGRPVASFYNGEDDVALQMLRNGLAVATPEYLRDDPDRLRAYQEAEAYARANRLGAFAGEFQSPTDYRRSRGGGLPAQLSPAPLAVGRQPMTPEQAAEYSTLLRTPETRPDQLQSFAEREGYRIPNANALLAFARRNPSASIDPTFVGTEGYVAEAAAGRPGIVQRHLGALNEGIADVAGFPVDAVNGLIGLTGLPVSDRPFLGSEQIRGLMRGAGIGQPNDSYAPQSDGEIYSQAFARGTGQAALPVGGTMAAGGRLAMRAPSALTAASAPRSAARGLLVDAARNPAVTIAAEVWGAAGGELGGEIAGQVAPGNPYVDLAARIGGGVLGGGVAGVAAARARPRVSDIPIAAPNARPVPADVTVEGVLPDGSRYGVRADGSGWGEIIGQLDPEPIAGPVTASDGSGDMSGAGVAPDAPTGALGADTPPPPPGFQLEQTIDMAAEPMASISSASLGSPRVRDVIDVNARATPMDAPMTEGQMRATSQRLSPADVIARPSNEIQSLDEFEGATGGLYRPLPAPNENELLTGRSLPSGNDGSRSVPKRGPADMVTWLRSRGGLQDQGGELSYIGMDNRSRSDDFARGEQRFGRIVNNETGMTLDDAAQAAWEAGYFPESLNRPSVDEFLDALRSTYDGSSRRFLPDDLNEVAAFEQARLQRYAVEKAELDGAPLTEDIGQPVTLADMEANTPPLSAFDDLPGGQPDFVGNIRLGNLDTPQDISRALSTSYARVGGFDGATRGRVTQEETARLASELGMTPDSLLRRRKGQAFNAEEALAARQILAKSSNELVNMARRVQRLDNPGDELLADFQRAWVRHVAIQEQIAGATAEAGRALAQFRIMADSRNVRGDVLTAMVQSGGGPARLRDAADLILEGEARGSVNVDAARAMKPTWSDKLVELWYNSLLSGPQTHVVNVLSNAMTALGQIPEHLLAAGIGASRTAVSRQRVDRVLFSEVGARSVGLMSGFREGIGEFGRTLRTGEPSDAVTKVEARSQRAISGIKGEVLRVPSRLLAAEDELFKAMARRMELHGLAIRQANKEGLRGQEAKARAADLIANPTDELLKGAFDYGRYLTFQRPLGPAGQAVSQFTQNLPIFKLVLPFVRTPTNLLKFTAERSPFAPIMKEWRADFRAGGARRDLAVARSLIGTAAAIAFAEAAAGGLITGSAPTDRQRASMMRANGWQPYSIRWGDQYYSYSRLDPFAMTIATAADFATRQEGMTDKQKDDAATRIVVGFMAQLGDKTWLSGVSDMVQALQDPDRYLDGFTKRLAGSLTVPTGVAQIARTIDPTARARDTVGESIQARIPGLSDNLLPQRDMLGRTIVNQGGVGPDLVSPVWQSTDRNDPVLDELLASRVTFDRPDRTVRGERLSGPQYDAYQEAAGRIAYPRLQALIEPAEWDALNRDDKQEAVRDVMRGARAEARAEVLGGQPPRPAASRRRGMFGRGGPSGAPPALPPPPPGFELVQ